MYRVMIVDDEPLVRQGIIRSVNWDNHGVEQIEEANDGLQALEKYRKTKVDILITDIKMPRMNGLELIRALREENAHPIIIVLSGYSDFEYLQEAIRMEVTDYLLKPLDPEELHEVIGTAVSRIRMKRRGDALARAGKNLLRENTFLRLIEGNIGNNELKEKLKNLNIRINKGTYRVSVFQILSQDETDKKELALMIYAAANVCDELMRERQYGLSFPFMENYVILLYDRHQTLAQIRSFEEEVRGTLAQILKVKVKSGMGVEVEELEEVACSFQEAKKSLEEQNGGTPDKVYSKLVGDLLQYLKEHYRDNPSLKEIAAAFYVNPSYLGYIFKKEYGESFIDCVNRHKVEYAKEQLLTTNLKIYEIAEKVGFTDTRYFVKIFKKYMGVNPSKLRSPE
ncbi:response regulator [Diplocloster agilis]|uniref:Stage 0 sporulation protein A homolog n=1 Tax=Diplocloster agilis TaxID=2850323 RepID=A0A949K545_9FIRM|nr:response regulator [Diplocloster agilis]MBU9735823.1 response regulator [Diplocloster agilis]